MVAIADDEVRRIARLARLALADDEVERMARDLAAILDYVAQIEAVDVAGVEGTSHAVPLPGPFREDAARDAGVRCEALAAAPREEEGLFAVPKIVE